MSFLDVPVTALHPAHGVAAWAFFLVGIACALLLGVGYLARLWRRDRSQVDHPHSDSVRSYRNHDDLQEGGERRIAQG